MVRLDDDFLIDASYGIGVNRSWRMVSTYDDHDVVTTMGSHVNITAGFSKHTVDCCVLEHG